MESNLSLENLSRRNFLTASALTGLSLFGLRGLEAQDNKVVPPTGESEPVEPPSLKPKQKTPEEYGIKMNSYYNVGLFLCNGWKEKNNLELNLEGFEGINKGLTSILNEEGKSELVGIPTYKTDEKLYLVLYNPKGKNHRLGIYVSEVVEEKGIKFINGKPYEVKLKRGKIVEIKPLTSEVKKGSMFYDLFQKKLDIIIPSKFEEVLSKGPFELNGNHKSLSLKLKSGVYSTLLMQSYEGDKPTASMANVGTDFKIKE